MEGLIFVAVTFALFWFLFIRPQQRRVRQHHALIASLEVGDEVVTAAGVFGTIRRVEPDLVHLEVAPGVELKVVRAAISRRTIEPAGPLDEPGPGFDGGPGPIEGE